jgi:transcriptional regulator with XRE-family HTH domain
MLRYKRLIHKKLDPDSDKPLSLRDLAKELGIPVPSLHNYVNFDTLPRIDNIQKMADYFRESISSMFSDDDDLTARLVAKVRKLSDKQKSELINSLTNPCQ